jgi:hypothetical protein
MPGSPSNGKNDLYKANGGGCSNYNTSSTSKTSTWSDKRSVTQNNIKIGTMVGNLHLGPSFTISGARFQTKR